MSPIPAVPGSQLSDSDAELLKRLVEQMAGVPENMFPGSQPVSFTKHKSLLALQTSDFLVCEKSDGVRVLLLVQITAHGQSAFLITRKSKYHYLSNMLFPTSQPGTYHQSTLVDAELVSDREPDGTWVTRLLCFDALWINGRSCMQLSLPQRLELLDRELVQPYTQWAQRHNSDKKEDLLEIAMKQFQPSYKAEHIYLELIPSLAHASDGLIFTSCAAPYTPGTCDQIIKWKPASENSVDFVARLVPQKDRKVPEVHLYTWKGNNRYEYFSMLAVTEKEWVEELEKISLDGAVIEAYRDRGYCPPAEWRFMRVRDDKDDANHASVLSKILVSIDDGVEMDELADAMVLVEKNWTKRSTGQ